MSPLLSFRHDIVAVFEKLSQHRVGSMAAALAYYSALSLAPLLILLLAFISTFSMSFQNELIVYVQEFMGTQVARPLGMILRNISNHPDLKSLADFKSVAILIFSASAIFVQLQISLNVTFETEEDSTKSSKMQSVRRFLIKRLSSFAMVMAFILISLISMVASSIFAFMANWLGEAAHLFGTLALFSLFFFAIFKWMPDCKVKSSSSVKGAVVAGFLFVLGKSAIGLYLGRLPNSTAYGAASSLLIILIWAYYCSLIILFGAEITAHSNRRVRTTHVLGISK